MLALLLDEHISIEVARQIRKKRADIDIISIYEWRNAELVAEEDDPLLSAAHEEGKTLVTYDQQTIPLILREWAISCSSHSGVLFIDNKTIRSSNIGGLVRALIYYWDLYYQEDHTDRVDFLRPAH